MIKKISAIITAAAMTAAMSSAVLAEDRIRVVYDGEDISFDVPPMIINDRTMVPFRAIFEAFDADVSWDPDERAVTALSGSTYIYLKIDDDTMLINDSATTLDSPPVIVNDRTLVPVRAVAEGLHKRVSWDQTEQTVIISDIADGDGDETSSDQEYYELHRRGGASVSLGKSTYSISVPDSMRLFRTRTFSNDILSDDSVISQGSGFSLRLNTRCDTEIPKSFDELVNNYKSQWKESEDTYEKISFQYGVDGNYEVCRYIVKHSWPVDRTDISESEDGYYFNMLYASDLTVYEAAAIFVNTADRSDMGYLSVYSYDESGIELLGSIIDSMRAE